MIAPGYTDAQRELWINIRSLVLKALDIGDRFYNVGKYKAAKLEPLAPSETVTIAASVQEKVNDDKLSPV